MRPVVYHLRTHSQRKPVNHRATCAGQDSNRTTRTYAVIKTILIDVDVLQSSSNWLSGIEKADGFELNKKIAEMFRHSINDPYVTSARFVSSDGIKDGWDTPLEFANTNSTVLLKLNPRIGMGKRPFIL